MTKNISISMENAEQTTLDALLHVLKNSGKAFSIDVYDETHVHQIEADPVEEKDEPIKLNQSVTLAPGVPISVALASVLNQFSAESVSGTPDYILAEHLLECLKVYNETVSKRDKWRGSEPEFYPPARPLGVEHFSKPNPLTRGVRSGPYAKPYEG